jgi:L-asparagine transporter-like permease
VASGKKGERMDRWFAFIIVFSIIAFVPIGVGWFLVLMQSAKDRGRIVKDRGLARN